MVFWWINEFGAWYNFRMTIQVNSSRIALSPCGMYAMMPSPAVRIPSQVFPHVINQEYACTVPDNALALNKWKYIMLLSLKHICVASSYCPDSKVHGANMGSIWGRQAPGGPHVGPMNFIIWVGLQNHTRFVHSEPFPCCSIEDTLALMCGGLAHVITLLAWVLRIIYRYRYIDN